MFKINDVGQATEKVYCAFCKLKRTVYKSQHLSWTNVLLCILLSFVLMFGFWQQLDGRVTLILALSVIGAEVFVFMRWRLSMRCPHCHFDPVLYKRNKSLLVRQVRERLEYVQESGGYLLRQNNPLENLPKAKGPQFHVSNFPVPDLSQTKTHHLMSKEI